MEPGKISVAKVAGTYIGTIVGAGFASGQEVLQFFAVFGDWGLPGLVVTTILFIFYGYVIMDLGMRLRSTSHLSIIRHAGGKWLGSLTDLLITFFLFGAFTAMLAGSGALFRQEFGLSSAIGNALMAAVTILTVLSGFKGIINSISFVVPFLMVAAIGISLYAIFAGHPGNSTPVVIQPGGLMRNWLWSAILYTSYNTVTSIAILGPLGAEVNDRETILKGAVMGGLGLGIGAAAIYLALKAQYAAIAGVEVPMIHIAQMISPAVKILYAIVLLAEIYTTAVGNLYGFAARLIHPDKRAATRNAVLITSILALTASQFGFSNLVKYLYPAVGYGGILLLISLLVSRLSSGGKKNNSPVRY